ncbi:MAG: protein kinase, partial [Propionibacteriaceae bacterium]|nr:protein kinase [Propionibacteriaceae bacterium]
MKCRRPNCFGKISDGYCDICGMPPLDQPYASSVPKPGLSRPSVAGGRCPQPGCNGNVIDGYCDVCGSPVSTPAFTQAPALPTSITKTSATLSSIAFGTNRTTSFAGTKARRRKAKAKPVSRLGLGLTQVPSAPIIDPEKAVITNPEVPEKHRICHKCQAKVGQSSENIDSRTEGFCPKCGTPYSFSVKLAPGEIVADQYEVIGVLASGGQGWIYLAKDHNVSGRWVVLKGLLNAEDEDALAAATAEQQSLARIGVHPLIVDIYNFITVGDTGYIVMEYVGGRSLKQLLQQRMTANNGSFSPLPPAYALSLLIEILPALSYIHERGMVYCDFKPDNVIQSGDSLKLIDLGGVRHFDDDDSAIFGTVGYHAPEVATQGTSVASDIYTVGRTLMVMCADVPGYQTTYERSIPPPHEMPAFASNDSLYRLLM